MDTFDPVDSTIQPEKPYGSILLGHNSNGIELLWRRDDDLYWGNKRIRLLTVSIQKEQSPRNGPLVLSLVRLSYLETANATVLAHIQARHHLACLRGKRFIPDAWGGKTVVFLGSWFGRQDSEHVFNQCLYRSSGDEFSIGRLWQDKSYGPLTPFAVFED